MEKILMSLSNNYLVYLIIAIVIIIAIVGFVVDAKKDNMEDKIKEAPIEKTEEEKQKEEK